MSGIAPRGPSSNLQTNNPFGSINSVNTLFGGGATQGNPFGAATSTTSPFGNAFTAQNTSPTTTGGAFGLIKNPFGSPNTTTNNPFAAPSTSSSAQAGSSTPQIASGLFGASVSQGNPFGASQSGMFGTAAPVANTQSQSPFGLLQSTTQQPAATSSNPFAFGGNQQAASGTTNTVFGSAGAGDSGMGGGLFGSNTQANQQTAMKTPVFTGTAASPGLGSGSQTLNLFSNLTTNENTSNSATKIREINRIQNKLMKKLLELNQDDLAKLRTSDRTMRDEANCKLVYSQANWKSGHIPEVPPPPRT